MAKKKLSIPVELYRGKDPKKAAENQHLISVAFKIEQWVNSQVIEGQPKSFSILEMAEGAQVSDTDVREAISVIGEMNGVTV